MSGYVDATELDAAADEQSTRDDFSNHFNSMWDLRHTRVVDVSPDSMAGLIERKLERDRTFGLCGKIAIVVNRHTVAGAALLAKVKATRKPGRVVDVFPTEKQALEWLEGKNTNSAPGSDRGNVNPES